MQLAPVRLSELHSDLKIQEKDELQWKKLKAEGMDEDGEREAKLRRNFNSGIWLFLWDMIFKELVKKLHKQFSFICLHFLLLLAGTGHIKEKMLLCLWYEAN